MRRSFERERYEKRLIEARELFGLSPTDGEPHVSVGWDNNPALGNSDQVFSRTIRQRIPKRPEKAIDYAMPIPAKLKNSSIKSLSSIRGIQAPLITTNRWNGPKPVGASAD